MIDKSYFPLLQRLSNNIVSYVYQYTKAVDDRKLEKVLGVFVIEHRKPILNRCGSAYYNSDNVNFSS
jgi:hypothetical protein